jgi:hypothetical protein
VSRAARASSPDDGADEGPGDGTVDVVSGGGPERHSGIAEHAPGAALPAGKVVAGGEAEQLTGRCPRLRAVTGKAEGGGRDRHGTTATPGSGAAQQVRGGSSPSAGMPRSPFMRQAQCAK